MTVASVLADGLLGLPNLASTRGAARVAPTGRATDTPGRRVAGALEDAVLLMLLAYALPIAMLVIGAPIALLFVFLSRLVS